MLPILAVLTTMHYEGDVVAAGGDYVDVAITVPPGTVEIQIAHSDNSTNDILDFGVWSPEGFRGWGGGNTEDIIIGVDQSSRSYRPGPITPGTWTVAIGKAQLDGDGAHYTLDVTCRDNATLAVRPKATPMPVTLSNERRWYKGDFHVHSEQSGDANATLDEISTLARMRGLDFVNLSDHNTDAQLPLAAKAQEALTDFLFLRGAEITTYAGHGNAVGLDHYIDHRIGHDGRTIEAVISEVQATGAIFIVNHPTLDLGDNCIGCPWEHATTPWDKVSGMEVITGKWDVVERLFVPSAIAKWDGLLDQGFRIAAIGGSDDHSAGKGTGITDTPLGSPTTLVLADNLSEAAIIDGIKHGRTIVNLRGPDDPGVEMKIGDAEIGDDTTAGTAKIAARVTGGNGTFLQLWRDGAKLEQIEVTSDDFRHTFEDEPGNGMKRRYRLELINDSNNRIVVTSHIYVTGTDAGGGCCDGGGGASIVFAAPTLLLLLKRRRVQPVTLQ